MIVAVVLKGMESRMISVCWEVALVVFSLQVLSSEAVVLAVARRVKSIAVCLDERSVGRLRNRQQKCHENAECRRG